MRALQAGLPVKAAFLLGLLNPNALGPYRSQSEAAEAPVLLIPAPGSAGGGVCVERGGLGGPQPVLLPLFTEGLEEG